MNPKFSIEAAPFYPSYIVHRMMKPDEKVKNSLRAQLNYWLINPRSQFYDNLGALSTNIEGFVSLNRIATTRKFRSYEYGRIIRLLKELGNEDYFELSEDKKFIRISPSHPSRVASSIF